MPHSAIMFLFHDFKKLFFFDNLCLLIQHIATFEENKLEVCGLKFGTGNAKGTLHICSFQSASRLTLDLPAWMFTEHGIIELSVIF